MLLMRIETQENLQMSSAGRALIRVRDERTVICPRRHDSVQRIIKGTSTVAVGAGRTLSS